MRTQFMEAAQGVIRVAFKMSAVSQYFFWQLMKCFDYGYYF